jgi:CspA family cold shock protein
MMIIGNVKFFNKSKGYGFIAPTDGSNDVFVHITALEKSGIEYLNEGQKVSFEIKMHRGKTAADNIQLVSAE